MNKVISNVRKNEIKIALGTSIPALIFTGILIGILSSGEDIGELIFPLLLVGVFAVLFDYILIKCIVVIIDPLKSDLFKKYGSPEEIAKILDEIDKTKEYEDKHLIISKNYISDKKDYSKIVACDDVLGVHKLVHKTNFVVDYFQIVITDKYGFEITYSYPVKEEEKCDKLLSVIAYKCKNAKAGYTKQEQEHIKANKQELPNIIKQKVEDEYICPDCNNKIIYGDKFCKECGCKLNWDEDYEEKEEIEEVGEQEEKKEIKEQKTGDMQLSISELADAIVELGFKQVDEIDPILKVQKVKYSFDDLFVTTIAYYSSIFLAHIGKTTNIKVKDFEKLEKETREKCLNFIDVVMNDVHKDDTKKIAKLLTLFSNQYEIAKKEALDSIDKKDSFVDKGITDKYLISFLNKEDALKVKMYVLTQILGVWVVQASEGSKAMKLEI